MTGLEWESSVMLFVIFLQLLKLCTAIRKFVHRSIFALRQINLSLSQQLSDCADGACVICLFYNTITPTVYGSELRVDWYFRSLLPFGTVIKSFYPQSCFQNPSTLNSVFKISTPQREKQFFKFPNRSSG